MITLRIYIGAERTWLSRPFYLAPHNKSSHAYNTLEARIHKLFIMISAFTSSRNRSFVYPVSDAIVEQHGTGYEEWPYVLFYEYNCIADQLLAYAERLNISEMFFQLAWLLFSKVLEMLVACIPSERSLPRGIIDPPLNGSGRGGERSALSPRHDRNESAPAAAPSDFEANLWPAPMIPWFRKLDSLVTAFLGTQYPSLNRLRQLRNRFISAIPQQ